jgi:hypothetical protein
MKTRSLLFSSLIILALSFSAVAAVKHEASAGRWIKIGARIQLQYHETEWTRTSIGANYFIDKHRIKYQVTYRMGENVDGEAGNDLDELFVQAQYVF